MKGLVIRSPWIELILSGGKTWEMRTRPTSIRGRIALIKAGSGFIYGTAELTECLPALTSEKMRQTQHFHAIPEEQVTDAVENRWTTPWVLRDVSRLDSPMPYDHPNGAVTWVELSDQNAESGDQREKHALKPKEAICGTQTVQASADAASLESSNRVVEWVDIQLTAGNIRNGHVYLRTAERILPGDCIGGPNKDQAAKNIRVQFDPGMQIESDIAGDKMIFRARAPVRDFFERTGAKAGDRVRISRIGDHDFVVTLRQAA